MLKMKAGFCCWEVCFFLRNNFVAGLCVCGVCAWLPSSPASAYLVWYLVTICCCGIAVLVAAMSVAFDVVLLTYTRKCYNISLSEIKAYWTGQNYGFKDQHQFLDKMVCGLKGFVASMGHLSVTMGHFLIKDLSSFWYVEISYLL